MTKNKTYFIAFTVVFAASYVGLCLGLHPLSYGAIQVRVADALYPLIALFGTPALLGCVIGHFIANLFSPLGVIDLLSVALFIPAKLAILKWHFKGVAMHVVSVAFWVGYMLHMLYSLPLLETIVYVGIGETIAEMVLGRWLYLELKKRVGG
ncbi:MAG: QueT transporter family protein [Candidatus Bathyarchaeia archaeon]